MHAEPRGSFPRSVLGVVMLGILTAIAPAMGQEGNAFGRKAKDSGSSTSSTATTYSGRAFAIQAQALGISATVSDTGSLPPEGGALEASLLTANLAGLVDAKVCHASTVGQGHVSRSASSIAEVVVTVAGNLISAGFVMARATAWCDDSGNANASGCSELVELRVNGDSIAISGVPNQENLLLFGLGRIIINEQQKVVDGNCADITVNALHIIVPGIADIILGHAHADICCGTTHAEVRDFLTGGGFITGTPTGAKANFGVAGGIKNGAFWGHLNYIDHGTGMHVKHVAITGYEATGPNERRISGTCTIDGQEGFFSVFAADNGEPGTSDTFNIFLSTGYSAGGYLGGGNIQLHR